MLRNPGRKKTAIETLKEKDRELAKSNNEMIAYYKKRFMLSYNKNSNNFDSIKQSFNQIELAYLKHDQEIQKCFINFLLQFPQNLEFCSMFVESLINQYLKVRKQEIIENQKFFENELNYFQRKMLNKNESMLKCLIEIKVDYKNLLKGQLLLFRLFHFRIIQSYCYHGMNINLSVLRKSICSWFKDTQVDYYLKHDQFLSDNMNVYSHLCKDEF